MNNNINIKETNSQDIQRIIEVEEKAFASPDEAELSVNLINDKSSEPMLSLLAFDENKAVGHILFTRAYIENRDVQQPLIHILAPLAIIPEYQKKGIGGMLIKAGLKILKERRTEMVFVLGHIDYYSKYGFINNASKYGYEAPYPIPEEVKDAWMLQSLNPEGFVVEKGKVLCAKAMDREEYWRE